VAVLVASLVFEVPAAAQDQQPVIVEYVAPPECASPLAFQVLLETQIARFPNPGRTWRWSVRVHRRNGGYEGTLTSEAGAHTAAAARCDDVTAALALLIAQGETGGPAPDAPPLCSPPPPVATPVVVPPPPVLPPPQDRGADHPSRTEWRLSARAEFSNHGVVWSADGAPLGSAPLGGGMGALSLEVPGGFGKMLFEVAAGELTAMSDASPIRYLVLDTQSCLLDLPVGATGVSVLGCLRVAGASFSTAYGVDGTQFTQTGGALWGGAGARVRLQTSFRLFLEVSLTGMYGTVSSGESTTPGWVDSGLSAGFRL